MVKTVVIVGSGFGGLEAALNIRDLLPEDEIIVIDKKQQFTYQPTLHSLACGFVKKKSVVMNLEKIFRKNNIKFYQEEAVEVKPLENSVITKMRKINFDYLVLSTGGMVNYHDMTDLEEHYFKLKRVLDAENIRVNIKEEIKKAKHYNNPPNIVICGGGLTGVELAAEIADKVKGKAKITILQSGPKIMNGFSKEVVKYSELVLKKKGVDIRTNSTIVSGKKGMVCLKNGEEIYASIIIWCGGVKSNPLNYKAGLGINDKGLIMVNEFLQTTQPHIYAVGDCSYNYKNPQPATAQSAMHQGELVAYNIYAEIKSVEKKVFIPGDHPYLISIGRMHGVMIKKKSLKKGFIPILLKKFVQKEYMFKHRHWMWPLKKVKLK